MDLIVPFGLAGTIVTLLVFARNDGKREGRISALQENVAQRLESFDRTLDRINGSIDRQSETLTELAQWRGGVDARVDAATRLAEKRGRE